MLAGLSMVTWVSSSSRLLLFRSPALTVRKMALPFCALLPWKVHPVMSPCMKFTHHSGQVGCTHPAECAGSPPVMKALNVPLQSSCVSGSVTSWSSHVGHSMHA